MRILRMFLLHFEGILDHRARSFVWFLTPLLSTFLFVMFWRGAFAGKNTISQDWSFSSIASYFFLLLIATTFLECHIEEDVSRIDIREGGLVKYLTRPISYYWIKFFEEFPYRVLQGSYGIILCIVLPLFFKNFFVFSDNPLVLLLSIVIAAFALFISFTFKMIIGLVTFWIIDTGGFYQLVQMVQLLFAGYILPIDLLPQRVGSIAKILPFSYMIYFPVIAFEGKLSIIELFNVIWIQIFWLSILLLLYKLLFTMGVKNFTAVGQ